MYAVIEFGYLGSYAFKLTSLKEIETIKKMRQVNDAWRWENAGGIPTYVDNDQQLKIRIVESIQEPQPVVVEKNQEPQAVEA